MGVRMNKYTYTIHREQREISRNQSVYREDELRGMTTYQLREICRNEKLVKNTLTSLEREELIRLIMRYRGQDGYRHINKMAQGGIERLDEFLRKVEKEEDYAKTIRLPARITIYRDLDINIIDDYEVESDSGLYDGNLLLIDEDFHVYTSFYLEMGGNNKYYLMKSKEVPILAMKRQQYYILYVPKNVSEFFYDLYDGISGSILKYIKYTRIPLLDLQVKETEITDLPLVIDFGSSNTTLGIFGLDGKLDMVNVINPMDDYKRTPVIPTVIGINGTNQDEVEFVAGYEAMQLEKSTYLDEDVPVFYDIKRWVNDPNRIENVITKEGIRLQLPRKELLEAYLEHIISLASHQFKCRFNLIQLLTPIRQRHKFNQLFRELLSGYDVECTIDEGMAVLFDSISDLINRENYEKNHWYKALIIDCGGGTTDLSSCRFQIDNNRVSYKVDLETSYENGDTNFGGNNLTYRIMQLLKVRIVEDLKKNVVRNIPIFFDETTIKEQKDIDSELESAYNSAESVLPTKFREYENKSIEQYFKVKNNFYYLFNMAEQIKKLFFKGEFLYQLQIQTEDIKNSDSQKAWIEKLLLDKWKLSIWRSSGLTILTETVDISFYIFEIETLLRPDIYTLMQKFLEDLYKSGELMDFEIIKLTGQSCKSKLFIEALKEYVPGRVIQGAKNSGSGDALKICCLHGALVYFQMTKLGYMKVNKLAQVGALPYVIMAYTHENKEKILVNGLDRDKDIGWISRFMEGRQLDLYLNDVEGNLLRIYHYEYNRDKLKETTQEEIEENYNTVIQDETDNIINGEMKYFVWLSREEWGFVVLPVLREDNTLYKGEEHFLDFEDDTWELNFFDGEK